MKKHLVFILLLTSTILADPGKIKLAKGVIDPEAPVLSAAKSGISTLSNQGTCLYIVQPEKNFTANEKRSAEKLGMRFHGNIPPNAYLV